MALLPNGANAAKIMHDIQGYHATPEEVADTARAAGAKARWCSITWFPPRRSG